MNANDSRLMDDIVWGANHDAFEDRLHRACLRQYRLNVADDTAIGFLKNRVHQLRTQEAFGELPPFRKPHPKSGRLYVRNLAGEALSLSEDLLPRNVLFVSAPGGGKTLATLSFGQQFAAMRFNGWFADTYKEHYRHLRPLFQRLGRELIILQPADWRFNPLQAGPCDPRAYLAMVTDLLDRTLQLPERAAGILRAVCESLYREFGIFNGQPEAWPTLHHVYERILAAKELNASAREALLDRLAALLPALGSPWLKGWHPTELAHRSCVFEMLGVSEHAKHLFLASHLFTVLQDQYARGTVNRRPHLVVAFDDCQRVASQPPGGGSMPTLDEYVSINRGAGICVWLNLQSLDGVPARLVSCMGTKFMGVLGTASDYTTLGGHMGMTTEQVTWARLHLRPGLFLAQLADGQWRLPFPFRVPEPQIPSVVTDAEAEESLRALAAIKTIPATDFARWTPHHVVELAAPARTGAPALTEAELRFLKAVIGHPGQASGAYAKLARMSGAKAAEIREKFIALGWLRSHAVSTGGRGRDAMVLEALAEAVTAVQALEKGGGI